VHAPIVVYATMFGTTAAVAEKVAAELTSVFGRDTPCRDVAWLDLDVLSNHDLIVLGTSTWNTGQLPSDWAPRLTELAALDLRGKRVALFGTGDQRGYPDTFVDALDDIASTVGAAGATLLGTWPAAGYRFTASRALRNGRLLGLALDEDNEPERTDERVRSWVAALAQDVGVALPARAAAAAPLVPG